MKKPDILIIGAIHSGGELLQTPVIIHFHIAFFWKNIRPPL